MTHGRSLDDDETFEVENSSTSSSVALNGGSSASMLPVVVQLFEAEWFFSVRRFVILQVLQAGGNSVFLLSWGYNLCKLQKRKHFSSFFLNISP